MYSVNFILQFFMVFFSIFSIYLGKVVIDALEGVETLAAQDFFLEVWVVNLLSEGRGPEYLCENLYLLPIALIISAVFTAFFSWARMYYRSFSSSRIYKDLQYKVFSHLERLPYTYFKKAKSGDLIQTCTRDLDILRRLLMGELSLITYSLFSIIICGGILLSISWSLTLVSLSFLPIMFVYSFFLIKGVRKRFRATDDSEAMMTDKISENLNAVRVVKAYHNEAYEIASFEERLSDYKKKFVSWRLFSSFFFSSTDILVFGSECCTLIYGFYIAITGQISAGTLYLAFTFVQIIVWPLRDCAMVLSNMGQYIAASERTKNIVDVPIEDTDSGLTPNIEGDIIFDHVEFHFEDQEQKEGVIKDLSFEVKKGQTVAILGKTGSGKSTVVALLTRLYDYTGGHIYIDGTELKDIQKKWLRHKVVPVLQEPFLFSRSLVDNIRIAYPEATLENVQEAARIAALDEAILSFKDGYDTPVGEKGITLSGGQRQRVAIARTLLGQAPVIIFDDSLSAVDTATDLKIRQNLATRRGNLTTFIITHRIATAKDADLILIIEDGRISEAGTHEELVKKEGLYSRIAGIQSQIEA